MEEAIINLIKTINSIQVTNQQRKEAQQTLNSITSQIDWNVLFGLLSYPIIGVGEDAAVRLFALNTLRICLADTASAVTSSSSSNSSSSAAAAAVADFQAKLFDFIDSQNQSTMIDNILIEKTGQLLCYLLLSQSKPFHQYLIDSISSLSESVTRFGPGAITAKQLICLSCIKELGDWSRDNITNNQSLLASDNNPSSSASTAVDETKRRIIKSLMESVGIALIPPIYGVLTVLLSSTTASTKTHHNNSNNPNYIILLRLSIASLISLVEYSSASVISALTPSMCDFLPSVLVSKEDNSFKASSVELLCLAMKRLAGTSGSNSVDSTPIHGQFLNWLSSVGITTLNDLITKHLTDQEYGMGLIREIMEQVVDIGTNIICHQKRPLIPVNFVTFLKTLLDWLLVPNLMSSVIAVPFWINFCKSDFFIQNESKIGIPFKVICETVLRSCYDKLVNLPDNIPNGNFNKQDFEDMQEYHAFVNFFRSKHLDVIKIIFDHCDCSEFLLGLCQQKNSLMESTSSREAQVFVYFIDISVTIGIKQKTSNSSTSTSPYEDIHQQILGMCLSSPSDLLSCAITEKQLNLIDVLRKLIIQSDSLLHATLVKIFALMTGPNTDEWLAVRRLCASILIHLSSAAAKDQYPFRPLLPNFIFPYLELMITKCTESSQQVGTSRVIAADAATLDLRTQTLRNLGIPDFQGPLCSMNEQASFIEWFIMLLNDPLLDKNQTSSWISGVTIPIYGEFCQFAAEAFGEDTVSQEGFQGLCEGNKSFRLWLSLRTSVLAKIWIRLDASVPQFFQESLEAFLVLLRANGRLSELVPKKEINQWMGIIRQGTFRAIHLWIEKWANQVLKLEDGRFPILWNQCIIDPFLRNKSFEGLHLWKTFFSGLVQPWIKMTDINAVSWPLTWIPGLFQHACSVLNELSLVVVDQIDSLEGVSEESLDKHIEQKMTLASKTLCQLFHPDFTNFYLSSCSTASSHQYQIDFGLLADIVGMLVTLQKSHIEGQAFLRIIQGVGALIDKCGSDASGIHLFMEHFINKDNVFCRMIEKAWRDVSKRDSYQAPLIGIFTNFYDNLVSLASLTGDASPLNMFNGLLVSGCLTASSLDGGADTVGVERRQMAVSRLQELFIKDKGNLVKLRNHVRNLLNTISPLDMGSASRNASAANLKVPKIYSQMYQEQKDLKQQQKLADDPILDLESILAFGSSY